MIPLLLLCLAPLPFPPTSSYYGGQFPVGRWRIVFEKTTDTHVATAEFFQNGTGWVCWEKQRRAKWQIIRHESQPPWLHIQESDVRSESFWTLELVGPLHGRGINCRFIGGPVRMLVRR